MSEARTATIKHTTRKRRDRGREEREREVIVDTVPPTSVHKTSRPTAHLRVLPDFEDWQVRFAGLGRPQKISQFFVVDLQVRQLDDVLAVFLLQTPKEILADPRKQTAHFVSTSEDGVTLATASLSVGEHTSVEAVGNAVHHSLT